MVYVLGVAARVVTNDVGPLPVGALAVVVGQTVVPVLGLGLDLLESALTVMSIIILSPSELAICSPQTLPHPQKLVFKVLIYYIL